MSDFVPLGYLGLSAALDCVGRAEFGEEWTSSQITDSERDALIRHKHACR